MVKAICDHGHVHTPHFFSYIYKYSLPGSHSRIRASQLAVFPVKHQLPGRRTCSLYLPGPAHNIFPSHTFSSMLVPFLLAVSLAALIASFYVWRATNSRPSLVGGIFGSLALLVSARMVSVGGLQPEMAVGLPVFAGMLYMGRAMGPGCGCARMKRCDRSPSSGPSPAFFAW